MNILIKIGGSFAIDKAKLSELARAISGLARAGHRLALVHGGGKDINKNLELLKEEPHFIEGMRVTDENVLGMVEMTLSGQVNKMLVKILNEAEVDAVGISGVDANLFLAQKKLVNGIDCGFVGEITKVNTKIIKDLWKTNWMPVVSPVSKDSSSQTYNINADVAASALASALKVDHLVYISDVPGVLEGGTVISDLNEQTIDDLIKSEVIQGGMIPKVNNCIESLKNGIEKVHILGWENEKTFQSHLEGKLNYGTIITL